MNEININHISYVTVLVLRKFKDKQNFSHTVISKTEIGIAQLNAPSEFQGR